MNILIMAQTYAPEEVSGAVLVTELSRDLAAANHHVTVVTLSASIIHTEEYTRVMRIEAASSRVEWSSNYQDVDLHFS